MSVHLDVGGECWPKGWRCSIQLRSVSQSNRLEGSDSAVPVRLVAGGGHQQRGAAVIAVSNSATRRRPPVTCYEYDAVCSERF